MLADHARQTLGPAVHARLGAKRAVGVFGLALASDVDDAAPLALNHLVDQGIGHLARAVKVQSDGFLPGLFADMQLFEAARTTSVVHQNVHAAQTRQSRLGQAFGRVVRIQVRFNDHRRMSASGHNFVRQLAQLVHPPSRHRHTHALCSQGLGNATPNAHAGPSYKCGFVFELQVHEKSHLKINFQMYALDTVLCTSIQGWGYH